MKITIALVPIEIRCKVHEKDHCIVLGVINNLYVTHRIFNLPTNYDSFNAVMHFMYGLQNSDLHIT